MAGWKTTLYTLCVAGHVIYLAAFHHNVNPAAQHVVLPQYPLRLQPHLYPIWNANQVSSGSPYHVMYPHVTSTEPSNILRSHFVANHPICPASVYMVIVLASR